MKNKGLIAVAVIVAAGIGVAVAALLFSPGEPRPSATTVSPDPVTRPLPKSRIHVVALLPGTKDVLEVATHDGLFESVDGGKSFTRIAGEFVQADMTVLVFDPVSSDTVYGGGKRLRSAAQGLLRSRNKGHEWKSIRERPVAALSADRQVRGRLAAIDSKDGLIISLDFGDNWYAVKVPFDARQATGVSIGPDSEIYVAAGKAGFWRVDGQGTWNPMPKGMAEFKDESRRSKGNGLPEHVTAVAADSWIPKTVYIGGKGIWKSKDSGKSWTKARMPGSPEITTITISTLDRKVLFAAGPAGEVYKSTDGGSTWRRP